MPTQIEHLKNLDAAYGGWHVLYPWFSVGHLLHADQQNGQVGFLAAAQKAAIFFNDTQRIHYLLHEKPFNKSGLLRESNIGVVAEGQEIPQQFQSKLPKHIAPEIHLEQQIIEEISLLEPTVFESALTKESPELYIQEEIITNKPDTFFKEENSIKSEIENADLINNKQQTLEDEVNNTGEYVTDTNNSPSQSEDANHSELRIRTILEEKSSAPVIEFEPYHTIDYFASQGIKVDLKADDKLGKQLKSFTSWLKTMKKLPTTTDDKDELVALPNTKTDLSLENSVVLTEAMAEVLVKQGKKEQASEIFQKLGLLHPEKTHYFAAQIEQLKN